MDEKIKGQVSVWVILGIVLAASIVLLFIFLRSPDIVDKDFEEFDPEQFLEECIQKAATVKDGEIRSRVPVVPFDLRTSEIMGYVPFNVDACFRKMVDEYNGNGRLEAAGCVGGACVEDADQAKFGPNLRKIFFQIRNKVTITEDEKIRTFEEFNVEIIVSP